MPDFPLLQEQPEIQIFMGSPMFSNINNLKNTIQDKHNLPRAMTGYRCQFIWSEHKPLGPVEISERESSWVRYIPLTQLWLCPTAHPVGNVLKTLWEAGVGKMGWWGIIQRREAKTLEVYQELLLCGCQWHWKQMYHDCISPNNYKFKMGTYFSHVTMCLEVGRIGMVPKLRYIHVIPDSFHLFILLS